MTNQLSPAISNQTILLAKARFFIARLLTYFSLLLLPVWIPKLLTLNEIFHYLLIILYILFLFSQWYLLAKEVDYRFKIHVKTNSSLERTLYRLLVGQAFMIFYFMLLNFVPTSILKHFYWGTWVVLGLYYSWPTRGKIIQESVSTDFNEYKFLDAFEKTTFFLLILTVLISVPFIPVFDSVEVLRLYIDPQSFIHNSFWNYLYVMSFPFHKFPNLLNLCYVLYIYFVSTAVLLLSFYSILRHFISRRLCLLGTYALTSCWSFSIAMQNNFLEILFSSASVCWLWSSFWVLRAGNYRAGLILGVITALISLYHPGFYLLYWMQLFFLFYISKSSLTTWYKQQLFRYTTIGGIYAFFIFLTHQDHHLLSWQFGQWFDLYLPNIGELLGKSFFTVAPLGLIVLLLRKKFLTSSLQWKNVMSQYKFYDLFFLCLCLMLLGFIVFPPIFGSYLLLILATFLSLLPLEQIFQLVQHVKSQRNMIFLCFLLICLLDSHMEGRVKILISQFTKPF